MIDEMIQQNIEHLFELKTVYVLSPFLKKYPEDSDFEELEFYFLKHNLNCYAKRMIRIMSHILCYYDCTVFLTEFAIGIKRDPLKKYAYVDIRNKGIAKIAKIIKRVVTQCGTSLNIYIKTSNSLISIADGFDTVVYSTDIKLLKQIKKLAQLEGVFFHRKTESM